MELVSRLDIFSEYQLRDLGGIHQYLEYNNYSVTHLSIRSVEIGPEHIAHVTKTNTRLQEIYLNGNNTGDKGAKCIAEAIKKNCSMYVLNNIGDEGLIWIAEAMKKNHAL
jgi:hypothetical protein